jgi:hypothetical protein
VANFPELSREHPVIGAAYTGWNVLALCTDADLSHGIAGLDIQVRSALFKT